MKALSLTQPWATLIAIGAKKIETRSWYTYHRGEIAIHAAKGLGPVGGKSGLREQCAVEPFRSVLNEHGERLASSWKDLADVSVRPLLPLGAIVAVANLVACIPTNSQRPGSKARQYNVARACLPPKYVVIPAIDANEYDFGNFSPDRFMLFLEDVRALHRPVPCGGALGLWTVSTDVDAKVRQQLALTSPHEPLTDEVVDAYLEEHKDDPVDEQQVERVRRRVDERLARRAPCID